MVDYKTVATSVAEGLNGVQRAMRAIPSPTTTPEFERWKREMGEASRHVFLAFGLDPEQMKAKAMIPCGGGWFVEWREEPGEWAAVEKS